MFRVVKKLDFCYGHRLLDYEGKCAHLHGHTGLVEVEFTLPELNNQGMVADFLEIKKEVRAFLEQELDHKMLLSKEDPLAKALQELGEPVFVMQENPTAENIAQLIFNYTLSKGLPVTAVRLWESPSSYAECRGGGN